MKNYLIRIIWLIILYTLVLGDIDSDPYSACKVICDKLGVVYGAKVTCEVTGCPDNLVDSLAWVVKSKDVKIQKTVTKEQKIIISTERDLIRQWGYLFANWKIDYRSNTYKYISVKTEPPVLNKFIIAIYTSVIDSIKPAGHEVYTKKFRLSEDESSDLSDSASLQPIRLGIDRKIYAFKTWWGTDAANSQFAITGKKALNLLTLGVFDGLHKTRYYNSAQMILEPSTFSGQQKVYYNVSHNNADRENEFKVRLYLNEKCNADMSDGNIDSNKIKKGGDDETLQPIICESESGEKCKGSYTVDAAVVCFLVTCNDNLDLQWITAESEKKVCKLNYSVQFLNQIRVSRAEIDSKIKDMNVKMPVGAYFVVFIILGLLVILIIALVKIVKE